MKRCTEHIEAKGISAGFRLSPTDYDRVTRIAEQNGITRSTLIRMILLRGVEDIEKNHNGNIF